jgi:CBS domain-containing membrane protein
MSNNQPATHSAATHSDPNNLAEIDLNDEDIIDAMQHISGYLDISTDDFRDIYRLAHRHALGRIFKNFKAETLIRKDIEPLFPGMFLDDAAKIIIRSGLKSLPVVDENGCVIGMLTETDYLRRLNVETFLELLLGMQGDGFEIKHRCHETHVREAMTTPAVTLNRDAGFLDVVSAFHQHDGRGTPIVDNDGHLLGMLLRKDFFASFNMAVPK